jgi:hypothetical protein
MSAAGAREFAYLPRCEPACVQGTLARLAVGELKPTQNAVGMDEVSAKVKKIEPMSRTHLEDYLLQRRIPVIIGNDDQCYMIDHHHLARALWDAGKRDIEVPIVVAENWHVLHDDRLWKAMASRNWIYPFDGMGAGPTKPSLLKPHVKDLDNDLYRSVAWYVRERYGFVKDPSNPIFAEFKWASFFRSRVIFWGALMSWPEPDPMPMTLEDISKLEPGEYEDVLAYARYLAGAPDASGLPGFIGRRG